MSRIDARGRALQLRQQRQGCPRDPHVIHRLVVAALRANDVCSVEDVGQALRNLLAPGPHSLQAGVSVDSGRCKGRQSEITQRIVVIGEVDLASAKSGVESMAAAPFFKSLATRSCSRAIKAAIPKTANRMPATSEHSRPMTREGFPPEARCLVRISATARSANESCPGQLPRECPAFHIFRRATTSCIARLQQGQPGERVGVSDQQSRTSKPGPWAWQARSAASRGQRPTPR